MSRLIAPRSISLGGPTLLVTSLLFGMAGTAPAVIHDVVQEGQAFNPEVVNIQPGDTVRWTWTLGIHTVTSGSNCVPSGLFNAPLDTGHRQFSFTFNSAGSFDYFCTPHCDMGMTGTVEVHSSAEVPEGSAASAFSAFPNPFGSATELSFAMKQAGPVRVEIFDASGRLARVIRDGSEPAGSHLVTWDGAVSDGSSAPAGIYYARISAEDRVEVVHLVKIQ